MKSFTLPDEIAEKVIRGGEFSMDAQIADLQCQDGRVFTSLVVHGTYISAVKGYYNLKNVPFEPEDVVDAKVTNKRWWKGPLFSTKNKFLAKIEFLLIFFKKLIGKS